MQSEMNCKIRNEASKRPCTLVSNFKQQHKSTTDHTKSHPSPYRSFGSLLALGTGTVIWPYTLLAP